MYPIYLISAVYNITECQSRGSNSYRRSIHDCDKHFWVHYELVDEVSKNVQVIIIDPESFELFKFTL
jgi:hypothetical protein